MNSCSFSFQTSVPLVISANEKISAPLDCLMPVQALWSQFLPHLCYKQVLPTYPVSLFTHFVPLYTLLFLLAYLLCLSLPAAWKCSSRSTIPLEQLYVHMAYFAMRYKRKKLIIGKPPQLIIARKEIWEAAKEPEEVREQVMRVF